MAEPVAAGSDVSAGSYDCTAVAVLGGLSHISA